MLAEKFQFTAAAATATAVAATTAANTVKFVADYLISNHCQNDENHLI
jgi:GH25 family lysozyme M1 (1,4-beta-N-acetylmuramidase)